MGFWVFIVRMIAKRTLVQFYERHANAKDPLLAWHDIAQKMEQQGLTREDLTPYLGAKSKVSEILSKKTHAQPFYDKKAPPRLKNPV